MNRFDRLSANINNPDTEEFNIDPDEIKNLINDLTNVSVPTDYKDLHLNLVFAFSRIENYLKNGSEEDRVAGLNLIETAKEENVWLGN